MWKTNGNRVMRLLDGGARVIWQDSTGYMKTRSSSGSELNTSF